MNTNDNHDNKTEKTTRFARRAAVLALPLGLLAATAAAPAQAAGDMQENHPPRADVQVPPNAPIIPVNLPIGSEGAEFTFDDWEAKDKTYSTGPLEGQVTMAEKPHGVSATDLLMFNPVGEEGDLGQVRVTSVDPAPEVTSAAGRDASPTKQYVVAFEIESLPGHNAPVVVQTAPFELEAAAEATDVKAFPPVNQPYTLQEPVKLYQQQDGQAGEAFGELREFDVIVNQSA